jgi:hypothetical protein
MFPSSLSKDMLDLLQLLQKNEVEFLVCGGHAVCFYGYPRMTMDFDLLIKPNETNAERLIQSLLEFGFGGVGELKKELFCQRGTVFTLGVQPNQIDLLTSVSSQSEEEVFSHQVLGEMEGLSLNFISYNDLIRAKKEAGRLKDQLDVEELEKIRG